MSIEEKYNALQAKVGLLVGKYKEVAEQLAKCEAEKVELQKQLNAAETQLSAAEEAHEGQDPELRARLAESEENAQRRMFELLTRLAEQEKANKALESKLQAAQAAQARGASVPAVPAAALGQSDLRKRLDEAEAREKERVARLEAVLAKLRERREANAQADDDGEGDEDEGESSHDSGVADSSDTTGQSDSQEESAAPPAPARPAWMEEAQTAEEAHERRLSALSPRTQRKQQLQGLLRRGAVFNKEKEDSAETKLGRRKSGGLEQHKQVETAAERTSSSGVGRRKSGGLLGSLSHASPASASASPPLPTAPAAAATSAPAITTSGAAGKDAGPPASPKKKKGHLELNSIIAALTPKGSAKEKLLCVFFFENYLFAVIYLCFDLCFD